MATAHAPTQVVTQEGGARFPSERSSQDEDLQARNLPEAPPVARGHAIAQSDRRGTDEQIVRSDARAPRGEICPERSVEARGHEVEGEDRKDGEKALHEDLPALALGGRCRTVDAVQELGSSDRGNADGLVGVRVQGTIEIERPPFGGDEDRRIDQRPHGDRGGRPWFRIIQVRNKGFLRLDPRIRLSASEDTD